MQSYFLLILATIVFKDFWGYLIGFRCLPSAFSSTKVKELEFSSFELSFISFLSLLRSSLMKSVKMNAMRLIISPGD
jgi:hypothetical protein